MFSIDIDLKSLLPHVIDAHFHVYGKEYHPMIEEYNNQEKRVEKIYQNINEYYRINYSNTICYNSIGE